MKKLIYLSIILSALCSCKKDHSGNVQPDSKKHAINFNVSGFSQTTTDYSAGNKQVQSVSTEATSPFPSDVALMFCAIYDANGNAVTNTKETSSQANFGKFTINLANGNYTVVFAAGNSALVYNLISLKTDVFTCDSYSYSPLNVYAKKISLTVNGDDVTNSVVLDRLFGQVQVVIQDSIPNNTTIAVAQTAYGINKIQVSTFLPSTTAAYAFYPPSYSAFFTTTTKPNSIFMSTATVTQAFNITINATKFGNTDIQNFVLIKNVTVQANKTTVITGKLFQSDAASPTGGFTVTFNQPWGPDINVPF